MGQCADRDEIDAGLGYGAQLCSKAIELFRQAGECNWLIIEAQDRQARFYGSFGFLKIDIEYHVPRYGGDGTVPMHLMTIPLPPADNIDATILKKIVTHIYVSGYGLPENDSRLGRQLKLIGPNPLLRQWP